MKKTVEKIAHSCGTRSALQVWVDENGAYDGFCFSCKKPVPNPYEGRDPDYKPTFTVKSDEQIAIEIEEALHLPVHDLPTRKLKAVYLGYFGITVGVSGVDGITPETVHFPYTDEESGEVVGFKVRLLDPKRMWAIGNTRDAVPFGWEQAKKAHGKKLFITEGEFDAVALFQILKEKNKATAYADNNPPVISIPAGVSSVNKCLGKYRSEIEKYFKEIVLVFDQDKPGQEAVQEALKIFPHATVVQSLPAKDLNDCLIQGRAKAAHGALVFKAVAPKNTRIVNGKSLHEQAKQPPKWGKPWPFPGISQSTRGINTGQTWYLGAGAKMGKSEMVDQLASHFIKEFGWKVFLVKPEQSNEETYKRVLGKVAHRNFVDPSVEFDEPAFDKAGEVVGDSIEMLDLYQHVGWETLEKDIRSAAASGCKAIFIDPITNLTNGMDAASANTKLQEIAQGLSALALDLDVLIVIFCHLRNPESGPDHSNGGKVLASQFAGSRAMARSCHLMIGLEGNKDPDLSEEERNIRYLVLLENRITGETGRWPLYWNRNSTLFTEIST